MEEWKEYKLSELCNIFTGKKDVNKTTPDGAYPFFSCAPTPYKSSEYIYDGKAIIVAGNGSFTGRVTCYSGKFDLYQRTYACVPIVEEVNFIYLYYYMKAYFEPKYMGGTRGSSIPYIVKGDLADFKVQLPSLNKQGQISSILASLDDKIEVNRRINENLEQQAQALFDKFLMNEELPRDRVLKDYAFINPTRSMKKGEVARYIDMSSLPTKGSFPSDWFDKPFNGGMKFQNGDTLMARITPCLENGKTAYINFLEKDEIAFGSTEYIVMSPHEGIPSEMFYFLARNDDFVSYAVAHMNGSSGRQRVSASDIENYTMPNIPSHLIEQFGLKANAIMETIKNNSLESRRLAELRDTLLPRLMSGELKVNDVI